MNPSPATPPSSNVLKYTSSYTAEQFRQYEQRTTSSTNVTDRISCDKTLNDDADTESMQETLRGKEEPISKSSLSKYTISQDDGTSKIPEKRQARPIRMLRHTILSVYRRLFSIVFLANAIALVVYFLKSRDILHVNLWNLATAASANIFVASTIRQDYIQGLLYRCAWLVPQSAPLRLRRIVAKLYENGGVHSGCGIAATVWFLALTVLVALRFGKGILTSIPILVLTCCLQALLILIVIGSYPTLRSKYHNSFEMSHRFAGWLLTAIFWAELILLASTTAHQFHTSIGQVLLHQPSFWFLILITFHAILPWLFLRRWEFQAEQLSNHAVRLHFKQNVGAYTGIAISRSPLTEWHPFATMPDLSGSPTGGSLICSSAGDWTKDTVANPRKYYWVKGVPKPGVLGLSLIFRRVVIVTTGSGIGPCLSILASPYRRTECRVLWSGPNPEKTFGSEITGCVRRVDPLAIIIDTRAQGRPDMLALAYEMYVESEAEAVFVISNPMLTRKIVYGMEARGVPAFGPIWDS